MHDHIPERPAAVLVSIQLPGTGDIEHEADLAELSRLVHTLGYDVLGAVTQKRAAPAHAAVLGEGKLRELARLTGGTGRLGSFESKKKSKLAKRRDAEAARAEAELEVEDDLEDDEGLEDGAEAGEGSAPARLAKLVVVDHEITPSQTRNLERATGAEVLDRTGVIVEIFHRHAKSREAKLQVEIARLSYMAPRLRETGGGSERQAGRGAGESAIELDRRKIRDRVAELRQELASVQREQGVRRAHRRDARRVALVGYTNAGKSSLMRALTGSEVLVADKLFATLDTTVRAIQPETRPRLLASDTVGFIKKLPHDLVASFKSTLDEALEASLLLYVADASDPTFRDQLEVTRSVLAEIGADIVPSRLVLNKMDRLDDEAKDALKLEFPDATMLSAKDPADVSRLRSEIVAFFESKMVEASFVVPYGKQPLVSQIHDECRVLEETYDESGAHLRLKADPDTIARFRSLLTR